MTEPRRCKMPELAYVRTPCHLCGAATEKDAERLCGPVGFSATLSPCGAVFDDDGFAIAPTDESLRVQHEWTMIHYACDEVCIPDRCRPDLSRAAARSVPIRASARTGEEVRMSRPRPSPRPQSSLGVTAEDLGPCRRREEDRRLHPARAQRRRRSLSIRSCSSH